MKRKLFQIESLKVLQMVQIRNFGTGHFIGKNAKKYVLSTNI